MAFDQFPGTKSLPEREWETLQRWKSDAIFQKQVKQTENGPLFVFFEGPPTANGKPGIHHVLSRVFKDIYIRFYGQRGYHIPRQAGWDCHGLPVEREVEKKLGIQAKSEIEEKIGLEEFNRMCRESVLQYVGEWNRFSERLGFWIDLDRAYFTMDNRYIESVWSLLKTIWEKGLIYQGYKVVPFDPVMGATMSDAEVALGYKTVEDPSLTVRFLLKDDRFGKDVKILVWTTTPWTLPSNVALAVHPDEDYVLVEREIPVPSGEGEKGGEKKKKGEAGKKAKGETQSAGKIGASGASGASGETEILICAKSLMGSIFGEEKPVVKKSFRGKDLEGVAYHPLLDWMAMEDGKKSHVIVGADFVTMDTGTGIVHIAPAFGADDLEVGIKHDLAVVHAVGLDGKFVEGTPLAGTFFKDADPIIIKELRQRGLVWKSERYKHEYPFGWRTGAPLLYYAKHAWYIRTTDVRSELIENNESIHWVPEYIKNGRFGNWLVNNRDWALSRERYWGTPFPVWSDGEGNYRIVGSVAELSKLAGRDLVDLDLHRPYIDEIEFKDPETGSVMRRVPEVIDAWFDSGSMPYAQWGYPVKGAQEFDRYFPADFICEAVDQTRGWFYTLLAVSTMISGKSSYKNVVCLGHVLDEKGEKMSKSKGNIVPPDAVFDSHGADAIRWHFLTGAPPGNSRRVGMPGTPGDPVALVHGFFNMIQNSVSFFIMYANVDGVSIDGEWDRAPVKEAPSFARRPEMDRWILSSLQVLIRDVTNALEFYDSQLAGRLLEEFADSLSNWYIRRSRRRFWRGELDADKLSAYDTLYRILTSLSRLLAPFVPFLADQIFHVLVTRAVATKGGSVQSGDVPESVHLASWPEPDFESLYDEKILHEGNLVQQAAELGRSARQQANIKVRQPLSRIMIHLAEEEDREVIDKNAAILLEELNVKSIEFLDDSAGILDYRIKPNLPRLGKRFGSKIREIQEYLRSVDPRSIAELVQKEETIQIPVAGEPLELEPEDILVESVSKEGISGAEAKGMLVALDTELTSELIQEGLVRDLVRNVQELRKQSGLNITDRIELVVEGAGEELTGAIHSFRSYIEQETLSTLAGATLAGATTTKGAKGESPAKGGAGAAAKEKPAGEMEAKIEKDTVRLLIRVRK